MSSSQHVELVDRLRGMPTENEWLEFKRNRCTPSQLGKSLSALANSSCVVGAPVGYLVFGIDDESHDVVGTGFDPHRTKGNQGLLHWLSDGLHPRTGFDHLAVDHPGGRVVVFRVSPAKDQPVSFCGEAFVRIGRSKTSLDNHPAKARAIWSNGSDWCAQSCEQASLVDLDPAAIGMVRDRFLAKRSERAGEIREWDDQKLLTKVQLLRDGSVTNAAVILLGRPEASSLVSPVRTEITWSHRDHVGDSLDHGDIRPPFVFAGDRVLERIRSLTPRVHPGGTMPHDAVLRCDPWVIREALCNCIAHQDYSLLGRIVVVEWPDHVSLSNRGDFEPGDIETVIQENAPRQRHKNPFLVNAMAKLGLINMEGGGIKRMFDRQSERCLPMPAYDLSDPDAVTVRIPKYITDEDCSGPFVSEPELGLDGARHRV